jgi:TorA-specific chaperone
MNNKDINTARSRVYQLLSSLFAKEIDKNLAKELTSEQARAFFTQLASQECFTETISVIQQNLASLTLLDDVQNSEQNLLELAADYCGLFLIGTKHSASPYASLYVNQGGGQQQKNSEIFGEHHQNMMSFLQQSGLQVQSDFKEPADHISVILAYAGHLILHRDESEQLKYLQQYLASWLDKFVMQVNKVDQGTFYRELANLTLTWIDSELLWLQAEVITSREA